jgi:purine-binding chemotaxis protein CheW
MDQTDQSVLLICRTPAGFCGLPIRSVFETIRPLPLERFDGAPAFVLGLAVIRGLLVPVVDVGLLVGGRRSNIARFVTIKAGDHMVALAVDQVVGIRVIPTASLQGVPPLLREDGTAIETIGTLDAELLVVLRSTLLVPDAVWLTLDSLAS